MLSQGSPQQTHPVHRYAPTVASIGGRREEVQLPTSLPPDRDDPRQAVGWGVVGFIND
jgi:hypothetical protein